MRRFRYPVDRRSRQAMTNYLSGHFRYYTMNSWNRSTSYAHNLKIYNLGLARESENKLYSLINVPEAYEPLHDLLCEFGEEHDYRRQAGMNGRSGGYLVLYQGQREPSGYKSRCLLCGQQSYKSTGESGNGCGRCGQPGRQDYLSTHMRVVSYPGRGTDEREDFTEWSMCHLREQTELIQEFDNLADRIVKEAVRLINRYDVCNKSYFIEKTKPVLVRSSDRR